jgi:hypothetical protein
MVACAAVPPSPTALGVTITKEMPAGCRELGEVYGKGGGGGYTSAERKLSVARNEIRENAAAQGGDWVVMDAITSDVSGTSIAGRALDCSRRHSTPPPDAVPVAEPAEPEATEPTAAEPSPSESVEQRLLELKNLHEKELITDEEYATRKAAILEEL